MTVPEAAASPRAYLCVKVQPHSELDSPISEVYYGGNYQEFEVPGGLFWRRNESPAARTMPFGINLSSLFKTRTIFTPRHSMKSSYREM